MNEPQQDFSDLGPVSPSTGVDSGRSSQNLPLAIAAGVVAALLGAVVWAVVTVTTEYQIGFMAIGVGILVGFAVRLGRGVDQIFAITGAVLALLGCVLGNLFSLVGFLSRDEGISLLETFSAIDYTALPDVMMASFSPMDLLFYGIAIYEGYRFSTVPAGSASDF